MLNEGSCFISSQILALLVLSNLEFISSMGDTSTYPSNKSWSQQQNHLMVLVWADPDLIYIAHQQNPQSLDLSAMTCKQIAVSPEVIMGG